MLVAEAIGKLVKMQKGLGGAHIYTAALNCLIINQMSDVIDCVALSLMSLIKR